MAIRLSLQQKAKNGSKLNLIGYIGSLLCIVLFLSKPVSAQHLDVEVWGQGNALFAGFCRTSGATGCDLNSLISALGLPTDIQLIEADTNKLIFPVDMGDFSGGPYSTRNPGFLSVRDALLPNELLSYRASGKLRFWDVSESSWVEASQGVQIRLFGGLEASSEVLKDFSQCAGQLLCFSENNFGVDGSTIFSATGISGSPELVVDITSTSGILHTHLSFFLENAQGEVGGPRGAYLIEMQLISNARAFPSDPFLVLFNAGLDPVELGVALETLTGEQQNTDLPQSPVLPVSIPGDADLDGDVDRMDVALILLATQNSEVLSIANAAFDVDQDGFITRADALQAKTLCTRRLCNMPVEAPATALNVAAIYDHASSTLSLNDIKVDDRHYRAQLQRQDDDLFILTDLQSDISRYARPAQYNANSGILEIPEIYVEGDFYQATLKNIGNSSFMLESLEKISASLN